MADVAGTSGSAASPVTTVVSLDRVRDWAVHVLVSVGLSEKEASLTAHGLAFAEARGVRTHGFVRLATYVDRIRAGGIKAAAQPSTDVDLGALVFVDADAAIGLSSGVYCSDLAVERAREHGVGVVIARNANHFGAAAFFANRMADDGMLGFAFCNTDKVMCAPFGGQRILGTNPIAIAVPLPYDRRPQLDMATTNVAQGRLIVAAQDGEDIPPGWAVDRDGQPTTSATAALEGALLPSGGPKGFGLAFMIDALVALSGASVSPDVGPLYGDPSVPQRLGHAFMAIRADAGMTLEEYRRSISLLVDAIHESGPVSGPPALAPGEPELAREQRSGGHLDITAALLETLEELGAATGIPFQIP
jgi:LDH2 family malate/lactate/ureidoglycolate dehydrogenase